jgi:hypothetical protein
MSEFGTVLVSFVLAALADLGGGLDRHVGPTPRKDTSHDTAATDSRATCGGR